LFKKTAEIETGMAEKSSWDQANIRKKLGLVWRNRKKISQIIKDYFYLPFFLLIILCWQQMSSMLSLELQPQEKQLQKLKQTNIWIESGIFKLYSFKEKPHNVS